MTNEKKFNKRRIKQVTFLAVFVLIFASIHFVWAKEIEPTEIVLDKTNLSLELGKKATLLATILPEGAPEQDITWTSSREDVAVVDANGTITAKGAGITEIIATAGQLSAACQVEVPLKKPTGFKTTAIDIKTIKLQWKAVTAAGGYKIYRTTDKEGKYKEIASVSEKELLYIDKKRTPGKTYYYKVAAIKSDYIGELSQIVSQKARPATTKVKLKPAPLKMKVKWSKVKNVDGYTIIRATKKDGKYKRIKTIQNAKTISFVDKYHKAGKKYYYKVRAFKIVDGKRLYAEFSKPIGKRIGKTTLKYNKKHNFYYKKKFTVKAYSYCLKGHTAIGTKARVGIIAVDPKVIALRTNTYVSGYGFARAEDTGGNIKGKTIDVYKNTAAECSQWGVRHVTIYVKVIQISD